MFLMFSDMVLLSDMFYCCQICFIVVRYVLLLSDMFCCQICFIIVRYVLLLSDMFYCCQICFIVVGYVFAVVGYDVLLLLVRHIHVICRHYVYMLVTSARVAGMVKAQPTLQYTWLCTVEPR